MLALAVVPLPEVVVRGYLVRWAGLVLLALVATPMAAWGSRTRPLEVPPLPLAGGILLLAGYGLGLTAARMPDTALLGTEQRLAAMLLVLPVFLLAREAWGRRMIARMGTLALIALLAGTLWLFVRDGRITIPLNGVVDHANVLAYLMIVMLPLAWQTARRDAEFRWRRVALATSILSLLQLFVTFSAGALLGLAAAVIAGGVRVRAYWLRKALLFTALGGAVALAVVLLVLGHEIAVEGRLTLLHAGWRAAMQHPFTGQGVYGFFNALGPIRPDRWWAWSEICRVDPINHVHLEPLNALVEGGVFSALGVILLSGWAAVTALRLREDSEDMGWVKTLRRMTAAALVQGMITLAPTREGVVALVLVYGLLLARPLPGSRIRLGPVIPLVLVALLLAGAPLQWMNFRAELAYGEGRDPHSYRARDLVALRRAVDLWPEEVEARTLLAWELDRTALALPESDHRRTELLEEALSEARTAELHAPQFNRMPLLRAQLLSELGRPREALDVLEADTLFHYDWGWQELHTYLLHTLQTDTISPGVQLMKSTAERQILPP